MNQQPTIHLPIECASCGNVAMVDDAELWRGVSVRCQSCGVVHHFFHGVPVARPRRRRSDWRRRAA
jgi:uncharacterized Zn finger protein